MMITKTLTLKICVNKFRAKLIKGEGYKGCLLDPSVLGVQGQCA